jgi:hypothetical protein
MYHIARRRDWNTIRSPVIRMKHVIPILAAVIASVPPACSGAAIFPEPKELVSTGAGFDLGEGVVIALPSQPSDLDVQLATLLANEFADRFDFYPARERMPSWPPSKRVIVMGAMSNPLVRDYCAKNGIDVSGTSPGPEGYILRVEPNLVLVAGSDDRGAFYGLQSLRQLIIRKQKNLQIDGVRVRDWPSKPFRGIKLYLPGRVNIPFFKRFVRDFMALYKYNTLIVEMNASMRLERHPELNSGWLDFGRDTNYSRRNYPPGAIHDMEQNSSHQDTADGGFLEKEEVADLAHWVRSFHIELVPELPSFTHSYYLLSRHKELSEVPGQKWPDTYCPSNPKSYELLFDVYDEYIDLLKPSLIHVGHDELFMPVGLCPRCKDKDIGERYGEDVKKIHDYLAAKGIRMAMWGDMLLTEVRGTGLQAKKAPDGWAYSAPGGMTRDQVKRLVPRDILIFNWFWKGEPDAWSEEQAQKHEALLDEMGFQQVFGNFNSGIENYVARSSRRTILGGAPSVWAATTEVNLGKDMLPDFLSCESMLWSGKPIQGRELSGLTQSMMPEVRTRFRGQVPPSETETAIAPLNISAAFNTTAIEPRLGIDLSSVKAARVFDRTVPFDIGLTGEKAVVLVAADGTTPSGITRESPPIPIAEDPTALVFLHASAKPAANREAYRVIWDMDDTADLLGWYEVVYEDGFVTTIPIRYGVNILEWNWQSRTSPNDYCYGADAVNLGATGVTFFAFEWKNPRLGKVIREVRLKGTQGFRGPDPGFTNDYGPVIPNNGVILGAISVVKKR